MTRQTTQAWSVIALLLGAIVVDLLAAVVWGYSFAAAIGDRSYGAAAASLALLLVIPASAVVAAVLAASSATSPRRRWTWIASALIVSGTLLLVIAMVLSAPF